MAAVPGNRYKLIKLLSETPQIETWQGLNTATQRECVVKTAAEKADIDSINAILNSSFKCQRGLHSCEIVTGREKHREHGRVFVEYPLLTAPEWQALSPRFFWADYPRSLVRISLIVDLLHSFDLVHGDLKIENFLIRTVGQRTEYALVDLDFLCPDNSEPGSRVFGTPDHIAPEILANDRVLVQSDSYSLGVSLQRYMEALDREPTLGNVGRTIDAAGLTALTETLRTRDFVRRPRYLLGALRDHGVLDGGEFESVQKELLSRILLVQWLKDGRRKILPASELRRQVVSQSRVLGVADGLFTMVSHAMTVDHRSVFRRIGDVLSKATVNRYADYWHVGLPDETLLELYDYLQNIDGTGVEMADGRTESEKASIGTQLGRIDELTNSGQIEYAFLKCRELLDRAQSTQPPLPDTQVIEFLQRLARLAKRQGRNLQAEEYLSKLLELLPENSPSYSPVLEDAVAVNHTLGRYDRSAALIEERLSKVSLDSPSEYDLNLYRMRGWLCALKGDYVQAEEICAEVLAKATSLGYGRVQMLAHYSIGVMNHRRGRLQDALADLEKSLGVAHENELIDKSTPVLAMMTLVCTELGEYGAAVKYGKSAVRVATEHPDAAYLSFLCLNISYAYTRLADFPKAHYWTQLYLDLGKRDADAACLANFYASDGFILLNQGNLQLGRQSLHKALTLVDERVSAKLIGKIHLNLTEVAVYQGDSAACREHSEASQAAFASIQDWAEVAEAKSIPMVWDLAYGKTEHVAEALSLVETLIAHNCRYSAARLVFHLILARPGIDPDRLGPVIKPFRPILHSSSVPAFQSLFLLLEAIDAGGLESPEGLGLMRKALRETLRSQARFASLGFCRAIGKGYLKRGQFRHAEKYLSEAIRLAETLSNRLMVESSGKLLDEIAHTVSDQAPVVESFHGVSAILKEIAHTEESYQRLLQFALDQTGAERAVLLLRRWSSPNLYVAASLNCDSKSEEEITSISSGVAGRTLEQINPLIVDNALSDRRTKNYSSIVAHNILSVACIPMIYGDQLQGVLYLDHATLPSLFNSRDIKYLIGISNFLSTIIATVRAYRGLDQSNIQLRQDLSRYGDTGNFITTDPSTLTMLERLPEVAHADVPVLIQGESGTGKEIICEMLHRGSRRSDRPLVKLNCAAIAETMVESELFGVANNVATGVSGREGKLSAANGGTLLLDEIADMPLDTQAKLLRAIEYQQFEKVGSNRPIHTDIRFVCATNKDLVALLGEGKFRKDLYYRINTIVIEIPPLRDRPGDIELLLDHFLRTFSVGRRSPQFDAEIRQRLASYHWPGNVRELKNFVERCCILYPGRSVAPTAFQDYVASSECPSSSRGMSPDAEKQLIRRTLHETGWNQSRAANLLRMPLSTLRRRMKKYGLLE